MKLTYAFIETVRDAANSFHPCPVFYLARPMDRFSVCVIPDSSTLLEPPPTPYDFRRTSVFCHGYDTEPFKEDFVSYYNQELDLIAIMVDGGAVIIDHFREKYPRGEIILPERPKDEEPTAEDYRHPGVPPIRIVREPDGRFIVTSKGFTVELSTDNPQIIIRDSRGHVIDEAYVPENDKRRTVDVFNPRGEPFYFRTTPEDRSHDQP